MSMSLKAAAARRSMPSPEQVQSHKVEESVAEDLRSPIIQPQLIAAWNALSKLKEPDEMALYQIMNQCLPTLQDDGTTYLVIVNSVVQEKKLQEFAVVIADYLRAHLKNSALRMKVTVDETSENKQFYTSTDKLKLMLEINPDLNLLRKSFELDLE